VLTITKPVGGTLVLGVDIKCGTSGTICSFSYPSGGVVELRYQADPGFVFAAFTGDCARGGRVTMDAPRICGATFTRVASPPPNPANGASWVAPEDQRQMLWVVGTPSWTPPDDPDTKRSDAGTPARLGGYWLDALEVTNQAYRGFVLAMPQWQKTKIDPKLDNGSYLKSWVGDVGYASGTDQLPVNYVNWYAASAYCAWAHKRLPGDSMGVCCSRGIADALLVGQRPRRVGRRAREFRFAALDSRTSEGSESLGLLRHARQRSGMDVVESRTRRVVLPGQDALQPHPDQSPGVDGVHRVSVCEVRTMETCSQSAVRSSSRVRRVASILMLGAILVWTCSLAAQTFSTPRGTVSNVRFARLGTTFTITYDLASTDDSAIFKVTLEVSSTRVRRSVSSPRRSLVTSAKGSSPARTRRSSGKPRRTPRTRIRSVPLHAGCVVGHGEANSGTLAVTTSPAGATVVVDGQPSGTTPATINLPSGRHGVAISRTGYAEVREEVEIEAGKTKTLDRRLAARADQPGGIVDLRGQWSGSYPGTMPAQLTIDRQDGQTFSGTLSVTKMAGKETTELQVEGKISGQAVELRELKVLSPGRWTLGTATGVLQADTRRMSGSGTDGRSSYQWNFTPGSASGRKCGPAADVGATGMGCANSPASECLARMDLISPHARADDEGGRNRRRLQSKVVSWNSVGSGSEVLKLGAARLNLGVGSAAVTEAPSYGRHGEGAGHHFVLDRAEAAPAGRQAPPPAPASARALDLRGSWQGTYAGAPAQLTIDRQDGPVFTGVLTLTTASGKEPSEVQIEARVSGQTVDLREVKLVKLGAARGWSLGSGSGTVQPNGQLSGTGKDSSHSYQWSFTRR
jgi:hypothetical protein